MVERREPGGDIGAVGQCLDAERALPRRRQRLLGRDGGADARGQPEACQSRGSQDDGVVFAAVELAQARVEIAAQAGDGKVRILRMDLGLAPQARGADDCAGRHVVERGVLVRHEGIQRHLALAGGDQREALRQHHRHVLHRMHRDVGAAVEQGVFELLDEQPLAADLGERAVEDLVAAGGHAEQFDAARRIQCFQTRLDVFGLPQGEAAFAGCDDDAAGRLG